MSQKNYEEWTRQEKPVPKQEEEYDLYLFWPSLSNRDLSSGDPPSSPLYGVRCLLLTQFEWPANRIYAQPVSLHSESTDYDSSALGSAPPVMLFPCIMFRTNLFLFISLVPDHVRTRTRSSISTSSGRGTGLWNFTSSTSRGA